MTSKSLKLCRVRLCKSSSASSGRLYTGMITEYRMSLSLFIGLRELDVYKRQDLDNAVKVAYEFYKKHPKETLIVVTADHETGGMSLGLSLIHI